jgi:hypothetical protein
MKPARRLFALIAVLAFVFGSLWPLVSSAMPRTAQVPNFICSQTGGVQHSPSPVNGDSNVHCPLCVVTCDVAMPLVPASNSWDTVFIAAPRTAFILSFHPRLSARPPPSHAPPAFP